MIPSKAEHIQEYAKELEDWEPQTADNQAVASSPGTYQEFSHFV